MYHLLFPIRCLLCNTRCRYPQHLCTNCESTLPWHTPTDADRVNNRTYLFDYQPPISTWIWALKFHGDLTLASFFARCWIKQLAQQKNLPQCIMPVPLHPSRLKQRGFNQALEIAKPIGKHFQIPIDTRTCIRIRNTPAQTGLSGKKRQGNVKNAFGLSHAINYQHVAILDDVITTGSTTGEIVALLKKVVVKKIDIWCCAKTTF